MARVLIRDFGGIIPKLDEKSLPENCAVEAINTDLQGHGIKPMYAPLFKRNVYEGTLYLTSAIYQVPTAAFRVSSWGAASYVSFTPPVTVPAVGANDKLYYAVYIPSAPTPVAGQGCINIEFSDGTTLGAGINDQNGLSAIAGNLSAHAGGWYVRQIPLGGQSASDASAITGKTISKVRLFQNHANAVALIANYAYVFVWDSTAAVQRGALLDCDLDQVGTPLDARIVEATYLDIDEDDLAYVDGGANLQSGSAEQADVISSMVRVAFSGSVRNKLILAQSGPVTATSKLYRVVGHSNHDHVRTQFTPIGASFSVFYDLRNAFAFGGSPVDTATHAYGWISVKAPTAAPPDPTIVGGSGPTVTRSYVITNVTTDGLESAPSPARKKSGNRDGSWNFAAIPTYGGPNRFVGEATSLGPPLLTRRRLYRTPEGSDVYRYVGELDYNDTAFNDSVLDSALGDELETTDYLEPPELRYIAGWTEGRVGGIIAGTEVGFCAPYKYHAWPIANRYPLPVYGVAVGAIGDHFVVLTKSNPIVFTGSDVANLIQDELRAGEACIGAKAVISSDIGVIYPGVTGWGIVTPSFENVTRDYLDTAQYRALVGEDTVACFDNRKLHWITQGATTGYSLERGAGHRALVKFEVPDPIYAMSFYEPRDTRWIAYTNSNLLKMGKLFGDTNQKLKWTWKSKLLRFPNQVNLKVAQVGSNEWDSLTNSMQYREGFYRSIPAWVTATVYAVGDFVTNGGNTYRCDIAHTSGTFATDLAAVKWILTNSIYSITITGLTQSEGWVYLKVWADADKSSKKVLVFDDFVVSDKAVYLTRSTRSDCWQFEVRGNIAIESVALATSERALNQE